MSSAPSVARAWRTATIVLVTALAMGALVVGTSAYVHARNADTNCARTAQHHPPDSMGTSVEEIRRYLAGKYATKVQYVVATPDGPGAVEMSVSDADGQFFHGKVRVVAAPRGGGWLIATTNTCGD